MDAISPLPPDGYLVGRGTAAELVGELSGLFVDLGLEPCHRYFASNVHLDRSSSRRIDQVLKERLVPVLGPVVGASEPFLAAMISKGAFAGARVEFHQDWTYTDERHHRVRIAWIPLVDVDESNGCMLMVPGSHRWTDGIRPSGAPAPAPAMQEALAALAVPAPMSAGDVIVYDPAILHGSCPNPTGGPRPAVAIAFAPAGAQLVHFHLDLAGDLSGAAIDEAFFSIAEFGAAPDGYPEIAPWGDVVDLNAIPTGEDRSSPVGAPDYGGGEERTGEVAALRTTLADPAQQAHLDQFGFVVVDGIDLGLLAELRVVHEQLGAAPDDPRVALHFGFHSKDRDYKRSVAAAVASLTDDLVDSIFVDHSVYLPMFITKWPGPNSGFGPHQDPTLVDERRYRGVTIWIPLVDTGVVDGDDNGMLHVVPGSHRFLDAPRTRDVDELTPFADHEAAILDRHGVGVPTRLGQAIVFDNRLIHYSNPNATDKPRLVASLGMRPSEASCVMVRRGDPGFVEMFEIDDDSYMDVVASALYLWNPDSGPLAVLSDPQPTLSAERFDDLCAAVGAPSGTVAAHRPIGLVGKEIDPGLFCAFCGTTEGLRENDRSGLHKAQLLCSSCREEVEQSAAATVASERRPASTDDPGPTILLEGRSILLVGGTPDGGPADRRLRSLAERLADAGATTTCVMLLDGPDRRLWGAAVDRLVVVDDVRSWPAAELLQRLAGSAVAGKLRGWRLRRMLSHLGQFDAAVLHGAVGGRVLERLGHVPTVVCGLWTVGAAPAVTDNDRPLDRVDLAVAELGATLDVSASATVRTGWIDDTATLDAIGRALASSPGPLVASV